MAKTKAGKAGGRRRAQQPLPQPPPPPPQPQGGYQYSPSMESQINQPYQDVLAAGNLQQLPSQFTRMGQQGQLGDIYGQQAAGTLGNYQQLLAPNQQIQQSLAQRIQAIQSGKLDVDPALVQQLGQQERDLHSQLQRQLGPDYASSSAGIEALGRFTQARDTTLASANFQQLQNLVGMQQGGVNQLFNQGSQSGTMFGQNAMDLYNQGQGLRSGQLTGAGQMLANTGTTQNLYGNIPQLMGQFGQAMSGQAGAAVGAQQPYQQDRFGNFQAMQFPTAGGAYGKGLQNSGDRWINASSSGGAGPGGSNMIGG